MIANDVTRLDACVDDLQRHGVRRVHVLAWRDLDDPDAGGSEVHAHETMRRWAERGLEVLHRTSHASGLPSESTRAGYRVIRRGSRIGVFGRTVAAEITRRMGPYDALVEIWNGVPWLSPVWCRRPRVTVLHHVHGPMWNQTLPPPFSHAGRFIEARVAPYAYRSGLTVTGAECSRDELIELGFHPDRVMAVPYGVDPKFSPGGFKSERPTVVAVGRLAPVKRFDLLIDQVALARRDVPDLELRIIGRGPLDAELQRHVDAAGAGEFVELAGRIDDDDLVDAYRSAWLVVSASSAEGWGLSLTEAAACGTPAVATDIVGHRSSVRAGVTGELAPPGQLGHTIAEVIGDPGRLDAYRRAATEWGRSLTWDASALGLTEALLSDVVRRRGPLQ